MKVKPEAATAVVELLMMGERKPETCWAVNKHQENKLENCCIWLEIYLNKQDGSIGDILSNATMQSVRLFLDYVAYFVFYFLM